MTKSLSLARRDDGVAIITIDTPDRDVNLLRLSMSEELDELLEQVEQDDSVRALLFVSGKPDGFMAGADIDEIWNARDDGSAAQGISRRAQATMQRIAELDLDTGAVIHGKCLGGGLELALACDLRFASDDRDTRLGLPEVKLGLVPGAGGTQRLPRTVGLQKALEMLLTGKTISSQQALESGLVDTVCPAPILTEVASRGVLDPEKVVGVEQSLTGKIGRIISEDNPVGRKVVFDQTHKRTRSRTRDNYPAPPRIIDTVRIGLEEGVQKGLEAEALAFGELATTSEARELMNLFRVRRELGKDSYWPAETRPRKVERIAMIGAGTMGGGISYVSADAGLPVRLKDISPEALASGLRAVRKVVDRDVDKGKKTDFEGQVLMHRIGPSTGDKGTHACDLAIEAVVEDLEVKRQVLNDFEASSPADAIFASNTSAIPISRLAEASERPESIIGMHYFSPVSRMPLCEVVATEHNSSDVIATCVEVARRQGKLVIVVGDSPGFYTTRILAAYLSEAMSLLERGAAIDHIDESMRDAGFPMGPFEVADSVGLDVAHDIGELLSDELGPRFAAAASLAKLIDDDRLGKKNGKGFYEYSGHPAGQRGEPSRSAARLLSPASGESGLSRDAVAGRCLLTMIDEAVQTRAEGILRSDRDGDAGAVFGLGFPPFLGGPFRFIEHHGAGATVELMRRWELEPSEALLALAGEGA